ncbi:MAG: DUF4339 domain-containing protein [Planctomycetota bacterium]
MTDRWYYMAGGTRMGPVDLATIRIMVSQGQLTASDQVCQGDSGTWIQAGNVAALFPPGSHQAATMTAASPVPPQHATAKPKTHPIVPIILWSTGAVALLGMCSCGGFGLWVYNEVSSRLELEIISTEHNVSLAGNNQASVTVQNKSDNIGEIEVTVRTYPSEGSSVVEGEWKETFSIGPNKTQTFIMELPGNSVFNFTYMRTTVQQVF